MFRSPSAAVVFGDVAFPWYMRQGDRPLASIRGQLYDHIALSVRDLDAWVAKLRGEGVTLPRGAVRARRHARGDDRGPEPRSAGAGRDRVGRERQPRTPGTHGVTSPFVAGPPLRIAGAPGGPLAGLTFAAKDLFDVAGHPTGGGNPDWARQNPVPARHAWAVQRLLDAGATLIGKTITDEVSLGILGENPFDGTPLNPTAPDRVPGGSSSGSASAVAQGLCDTALGTDTGGSVRVPASFCGLYGIRPTHGRLDLTGMLPQAPSSDTTGWFARDAAHLRPRVGGDARRADPDTACPPGSWWRSTHSASRTPRRPPRSSRWSGRSRR